MGNMEVIEEFRKFCRDNKLNPPMIPSVYDQKDVLGDIFNNLFSQAFRLGKERGHEDEKNGWY